MALVAVAIGAFGLTVATPARADPREPAWGLVSGAAVALAGFVAGGVLLGTSSGSPGQSDAQDRAGWLTIAGGFGLAPAVAHAVVGEWGRGAAFAAPPVAAFAGSVGLFAYAPGAVEHGSLEQQRVLWSLFGVGLFSSAIGVFDAAFALDRAVPVRVAPVAGPGSAGLAIAGVL
jgi:hypothetical protein